MSKKKSASAVGKLVDAQAMGRKVKGARTEKSQSRAGEVDQRENKLLVVIAKQ